MNLLDLVLNAKGGGALTQLASQFGLNEDQAASAVQSLIPALAGGLQRNINQGGLDSLLGALTNGQHQRYLEDPSTLNSQAAREDGNGILGHILGSKDAVRSPPRLRHAPASVNPFSNRCCRPWRLWQWAP